VRRPHLLAHIGVQVVAHDLGVPPVHPNSYCPP
jgi:hypothetical protein